MKIEHRRPGAGSWTVLCTGATSPKSCAFASKSFADGDMELRAEATDAAGNTRASTVLTKKVDNTAPTVSIPDPGLLRGTVVVVAGVDDGPVGSGVVSVLFEYRKTGTTAWATACSVTKAPWVCSAATTYTTDGSHDVRATVKDAGGNATVTVPVTWQVDNTAPTAVAVGDPGSPLQAVATIGGTASDAGTGVATWELDLRATGSAGAWTVACTATTFPYACGWDTTKGRRRRLRPAGHRDRQGRQPGDLRHGGRPAGRQRRPHGLPRRPRLRGDGGRRPGRDVRPTPACPRRAGRPWRSF